MITFTARIVRGPAAICENLFTPLGSFPTNPVNLSTSVADVPSALFSAETRDGASEWNLIPRLRRDFTTFSTKFSCASAFAADMPVIAYVAVTVVDVTASAGVEGTGRGETGPGDTGCSDDTAVEADETGDEGASGAAGAGVDPRTFSPSLFAVVAVVVVVSFVVSFVVSPHSSAFHGPATASVTAPSFEHSHAYASPPRDVISQPASSRVLHATSFSASDPAPSAETVSSVAQ
mmetsp:Transcript_4860/g.17384  ORF Transcript_4860/g.17384 Transcript_4860/m.17384 type:complete len:234 (-) Transcript_4860:1660-2361(-)